MFVANGPLKLRSYRNQVLALKTPVAGSMREMTMLRQLRFLQPISELRAAAEPF